MADVITRLKLESGEYDSKIKRATQGLLQMENECRKVGGTLAVLEKDQMEFVRSLGQMQTVSTNTRGKIGELTSAYTELRMQYNRLTEEEQKSDFGKALTASLDQLKTRLLDTKNQLADISKELGDMPTGGGSDMFSGLSDKLSGALQVFGGNLLTKGFELATGAVATFVTSIKDAAQQGIELAKQGEGIRIAFERLGRGDILDGLREATHGTVTDLELMKQAVKFNDFKLNINEMGTLLAFAQQKAKDTGQSVDYMVDSIVTGLGRQSLMILDNLGLSASEIRERMKQTGDMTSAVASIIRDQMAEAGDYVETAADRAAMADVELKNAMEDLGRTLLPIAQDADNMWKAIEVGALNALNNGIKPVIEVLVDLKYQFDQIYDTVVNSPVTGGFLDWLETAWDVTKKIIPGLSTIVALKNAITGGESNSSDAGGGASIGGAITKGMGAMLPEVVVTPRKNTTTTPKGNKQELDELQKIQKKIADLTKEAYTADETRINAIQQEIAGLKEQEQKLISIRDLVSGKMAEPIDPGSLKDYQEQLKETKENILSIREDILRMKEEGEDPITIETKQEQLEETIKHLDEIQQKIDYLSGKNIDLFVNIEPEGNTDMGEKMVEDLTTSLVNAADTMDLTAFTQKFQEALANGAGDMDLSEYFDYLKDTMSEYISEEDWPALKLAIETGDLNSIQEYMKKVKDSAKQTENGWKTAAGAVTGLGNALQSIEDPGAKAAGTVIAAIADAAAGFAIASKGPFTSPWEWIAFVASGMATMITMISAIHSATGFARGGIVPHAADGYFVPGTSYSGDITPIMANAGELVLNKSSQNNIAADLKNAESLVDAIGNYQLSLSSLQQGNLAAKLESGGLGDVQLETRVDAEELIIMLNNNGLRRGYGRFIDD